MESAGTEKNTGDETRDEELHLPLPAKKKRRAETAPASLYH